MKIIKIEKCQECKYCLINPNLSGLNYCCNKDKLILDYTNNFPSWCPLEDAPLKLFIETHDSPHEFDKVFKENHQKLYAGDAPEEADK